MLFADLPLPERTTLITEVYQVK